MVAVVADTAPLNYLVLIEATGILPELFQTVLIPHSVQEELSHPNAPETVRAWINHSPSWLRVMSPKLPADPNLSGLDAGERDAISLALEQQATLLLIDERDGAAAARRLGLNVVGTLSVLDRAAERGWVNLATMFTRLRATSFRSPIGLMIAMLERDTDRKKAT